MFTQRSTHCARRRLSCEQAAMSREREEERVLSRERDKCYTGEHSLRVEFCWFFKESEREKASSGATE